MNDDSKLITYLKGAFLVTLSSVIVIAFVPIFEFWFLIPLNLAFLKGYLIAYYTDKSVIKISKKELVKNG